ncbi:cyclase family protein [Zhongshania sp.]|uniref:cyclase family protein n=1 Tax=Zhongshania sp. TaxID=1971902 RepID=UPI0035622F4D
MPKWLCQPQGAKWGEFGENDQIGRMNLINPRRRRRALAEAVEGQVFLLSLPLDYPKGGIFPGRHAPVLSPTTARDGRTMYDWTVDGAIDVVNDDRVTMDLQYSTQWDGLSHYGIRFDADQDGEAEHIFYNGFRADVDFVQPADGVAPQAMALGIENLAASCVQGRGVLVDIRRAGCGSHGLVNYEALQQAMDEQGVVVETGDFLCIYTGYADLLLRDGEGVDPARMSACPGLDGTDPKLLQWIDDSGVAAICADNPMVEKIDGVQRCSDKALMPLHEHCLVKLGIHLGELWWFGELALWLAQHQRSAFLLTAPPLNLPGAVGSPAAPIATV